MNAQFQIELIAIGIIVLIGIIKYPIIFISIYLSALILSSSFPYIRIGPVYVTEVVLLLLFIRVVFSSRRNFALRFIQDKPKFALSLLFLLILGVLSLFRGYQFGLTSARDSVTVLYSITLLLVSSLIASWYDLRTMLRVLQVAGAVLVVILFIKMFTVGFNESEMATPRLFGARTSGFLFLSSTLSITGVTWKKCSIKKLFKMLGIIQLCMIILLSGTRNVWIASSVCFMFWLIFFKRRSFTAKSLFMYSYLIIIFSLLIFSLSREQYSGTSIGESYRRSAGSIFYYKESANASNRLSWWIDAIRTTWKENPLFGKPFGSPTLFMKYDLKNDRYIRMAFHNSYITVLYYTGFIGMFVLLRFVYQLNRYGIEVVNRLTNIGLKRIGTALSITFVFYTVLAMFNVILEGPQSALFFWSIPGMIISLNRIRYDPYPKGI